ncbi:1-aminocyclopropane-1-carboxylate synthase [Xylariaceae sp. FL0662B]|nr:1-aminocyclopropane-1-carboxylate synthase [Xylariaceae sp. FL0662B]
MNPLSGRAAAIVPDLDVPWRFAPKGTFDPDTNPEGLTSFSVAENYLVQKELQEFVGKKVSFPELSFVYRYSSGGGPRFPEVLAEHLNECFHPFKPLDGSEIQITGAATALHTALGWAIGDPGEGILTSVPVYGRFELDFGNMAQLHVVYANTDADTSFSPGVTARFEEALVEANRAGIKIRALLIVNPNNPLGRCYPRQTIVELMKFCQKHRIHFISDEVYGCSVFNTDIEANLLDFTSALSIDPTGILDKELLHVTYSLSKDFGAAGLRVGAVVTRSESVHKAVKSVIRFFNPSGASIAIVTAMLEDRSWARAFLEISRERIKAAYEHVTAGLQELDIKFIPANAGFFIYIDLSPYLNTDATVPDFELAQRLLDAGIFLHPREEHGRAGWFRFVYTQDPRIVDEGLRRMKKALNL